MDISYDNNEIIRKCFKCDEPVLYNLNVIYNSSNSTVILWNKFQIFVYENLEFENVSKVIVPEFQIHNLITSSNYLMSVDCTGNIHTTSLKFKNAGLKRFKYSFQPRECGIMACSLFSEDHAISLKYESDAYFLTVHKITTELNLEKMAIIMCNEQIPLQRSREKYILKAYPIADSHMEPVKNIFNIEGLSVRNKYSILIISFDKLNVYGCLFSTKLIQEEVTLVKLYTCPSQISNIDVIELSDTLHIIIGLTIGTLISLNLKEVNTPNLIHLNTALHKFLVFKDNIIYTDGISMWKAENMLTKDINFTQLFVKNVKDLIKFGDQIVCTTFNNITYTFSIDDERSYVKPQSIDEYCSAEKLFDNSEYLQKIIDEVKKNDELVKMQIKERNYITALSLSNRQDIMDNIIKEKVMVYENYENAVSENTDLMLTNDLAEYFETETFYFLIKIIVTIEHRLHDILSNNLGDLRVHITIIAAAKVVKTTTVKIKDLIKNITLLIPLKSTYINTSEMRVHVKMLTNMPGALDAHQKIWTVLYRKNIILNCEHFIKFNLNLNKNICTREPKESLEELILQTAMNQYGDLIDFIDITQQRPDLKNWHMYVRLPAQYEDILKNENVIKQFQSNKVHYILQKFSSEDFLKSKCNLPLSVGKENVNVEIYNDGFSTPCLKITSPNVKNALDIRNFLSDIINNVSLDFGPGKEFINHSFYITVENLLKAVREHLTTSSEDDILPLIDQFERKVVGLLPI